MTTFRTGAYDALIEVLIAQRKARKMTLRQVAVQLPEWLGFDYRTLHKIEKKRRDVSFVEVQELAEVLGTNVATLDLEAKAIAVARASTFRPARPPAKRAKAKR